MLSRCGEEIGKRKKQTVSIQREWTQNRTPTAHTFISFGFLFYIDLTTSVSFPTFHLSSGFTHLLFRAPVWVDWKVDFLDEPLDHSHRVRPLSRWIDRLLHHNGRDVTELTGREIFALFLRHLELSVVQNLLQGRAGLIAGWLWRYMYFKTMGCSIWTKQHRKKEGMKLWTLNLELWIKITHAYKSRTDHPWQTNKKAFRALLIYTQTTSVARTFLTNHENND